MNANIETQVALYHRTGEHDCLLPGWPGSDVIDRLRRGDATLREALIAELRHLMQGRTAPPVSGGGGLLDLARARIGPVVRGLFPAREHDIVLGVLERSIVLLTPHNIDLLLAETTWPGLPPPGSPATPGREVADT